MRNGTERSSILSKRIIRRKEATLGEYAGRVLAISHRWERPDSPDPKRDQLDKLVKYLRSPHGMSIRWVWYD